MSTKEDIVTGVVTFSILGVQGAFSAADAASWSSTLLQSAPIILIFFLIWRMRKMDQQHSECTANQTKMQEQVLLAYRALQDVQIRRNLPPEDDFKEGNFNLDDHQKKEK